MEVVALIAVIAGIALLGAGGELLVRGSSRLATGAGIPPVVVGLTIVAFGTSAPELAVSVGSAVTGSPDLAVGNVVGSNIANVLLILGIGALAGPLVVAQRLVRVDVPVMCLSAAALLWLGTDGRLDHLDGLLLTAGLALFLAATVRHAVRQPAEIDEEYSEAFGRRHVPGPWWLPEVGFVVTGLLFLVLGAAWLVDGAATVARDLGVSELVIGLTIVAVGTSSPELATTVVAARRGERDIAIGNVVGSNIFNVFCVLGLTALVAPNGVPVADAALRFDIPFMVAVCAACLPVFLNGSRIERWEGALFVAYYVAYLGYLYLDAVSHETMPSLATMLLLFAAPLVVLTLAVTAQRYVRGRSSISAGAQARGTRR